MKAAGERLLMVAREREQQPSATAEPSGKAETTVPSTRPRSH
jgi:hypothetical protein